MDKSYAHKTYWIKFLELDSESEPDLGAGGGKSCVTMESYIHKN